ncbi:MAG: hypothetical protein MJE63_01025 [Proteobacteria bacterium]|nr:hypothetical protein [Pseudomonadota bacterium]
MKSNGKALEKVVHQFEKGHTINGYRYGKVIKIDEELELAWINYPENPLFENQPAGIGAPGVTLEALKKAMSANHLVKLSFENSDPSRPVVVDLFCSVSEKKEQEKDLPKEKIVDVKADHIVLDAAKSLIIKCGEVEARFDAAKGQFVIEADSIRSTAEKRQRIQGGSVLIN